jgi:Protein of unknown function (DUF2510)
VTRPRVVGNPRVESAVVTIARMYDFESVSVSSYEAASLAATLTEKSADGWDVVAIVPAGSDVVAYLRRSSAADTETDGDAAAAAAVTDGTSNTLESAESTDSATDLLTPTSVSREPAVTTADITSPTPSTSTGETGGTGWGASTDTTTESAAGGWTSGSESSESSSWGGSAQQAAAAAATPSVPAGWYADPAGRFELRYWDGSAWTEHVSRGGQQYTDPPVA